MSIIIRNIKSSDEQAWRNLWAGYCEFYEATVPEATTAMTWARINASPAIIGCRVAEHKGVVCGFAHHVVHVASWVIEPSAYLEDLYVAPESRRLGIARMLLDDLLALAKSHNWSRVYWHTNANNEQARALYDQYVEAGPFVRYRISL